MTRHTTLTIIERALMTGGVALGIWCAAVLIEAQRTKNLPIEPVKVTMALPGDNGTPASPPRSTKRGTVVARIEAPSLKMSAPILEGTDDRTLDRGAGHIEDTPYPGEPGNVGIAGHRDTVFRPLKRAKVGDELVVSTAEKVYRYKIARTLIVDPSDVHVLDPTPEPTLTLVTCYPFEYIGNAPRRFIVQATLVNEESGQAGGAGKAGK